MQRRRKTELESPLGPYAWRGSAFEWTPLPESTSSAAARPTARGTSSRSNLRGTTAASATTRCSGFASPFQPGRSRPRPSPYSTASVQPPTTTTATETCPRCAAAMEWRHGTTSARSGSSSGAAVKETPATAEIRPRLEQLEESSLDPRSSELLVMLCWLVREDRRNSRVRLDASRRRAMFVLAARRRSTPRARPRIGGGGTTAAELETPERHVRSARRSTPSPPPICPPSRARLKLFAPSQSSRGAPSHSRFSRMRSPTSSSVPCGAVA